MVQAFLGICLLILLGKGLARGAAFSPRQRFVLWLAVPLTAAVLLPAAPEVSSRLLGGGYPDAFAVFFAMTLPLLPLHFLLARLFPARRIVLSFLFLLLLPVLLVWAVRQATRPPTLREIVLPLPPTAVCREFTIVQVSDLHLGTRPVTAWLEEIVRRINAVRPDLVVFTGDLLEGLAPASSWRPAIPLLRRMQARCGVVAVTGNHDLVQGTDRYMEFTRACAVRVLNNAVLDTAAGIQVAGIPDKTGVKYRHGGPDFARLRAGIDPRRPLLLLAHRPEYFPQAQAAGAFLQLSGHTHFGQFPLLDAALHLFRPFAHGLYRRGNAWLYASSGAGFSTAPFRLWGANEIVVIRLRRR